MNKDLILEAKGRSKGRDRGNMYRERGQTGLCDVARLFKTFVEKLSGGKYKVQTEVKLEAKT